MRLWNPYIDRHGLICQKEADGSLGGGDTSNREALFAIAECLALLPIKRTMTWELRRSRLEQAPGLFIRHPGPGPSFWSDPKEWSRDQQSPFTKALVFKNDTWTLNRLYDAHKKRLFKCQNNDWFGPAVYIRAFKWYWLWPLLCIFDLAILVNSLIAIGLIPKYHYDKKKFLRITEDEVDIDINHTIDLIYARKFMPTPISWLARKLYAWFRSFGGVQRAWNHYFRPESGGPPFEELYAPFIDRWIMK